MHAANAACGEYFDPDHVRGEHGPSYGGAAVHLFDDGSGKVSMTHFQRGF